MQVGVPILVVMVVVEAVFLDLVASLYSAALFVNTTDCHC